MTSAKGDTRLVRLSALGPKGWWTDHAVSSLVCGCSIHGGPDTACDVGQALCRLRAAEIAAAHKRVAR